MISFFKELFDKKQHVFCYGAGLYGKITGMWLNENQFSFAGYITTKVQENSILNKPVYSIDHLPYSSDTCFFLVTVSDKWQAEIVKELEYRNITGYYIVSEQLLNYFKKNIQYTIDYPRNGCTNVLLYHRVNRLSRDIWNISVSPEHFEQQMDFLRNTYEIIKIEESCSGMKTNAISITFDDGYADFYENAFPVLEKYKIPATIFISTEHIDRDDEFWWDALEGLVFLCSKPWIVWDNEIFPIDDYEEKKNFCYYLHSRWMKMEPFQIRLLLEKLSKTLAVPIPKRPKNKSMSSAQLRVLNRSPYITIGGHTHTHAALPYLKDEIQHSEISLSVKFLKNIAHELTAVFSYPFGHYDEKNIALLRQYGYRKSATTYPGLCNALTDSMQIPRNTVLDCDIDEFSRFIRKAWSRF